MSESTLQLTPATSRGQLAALLLVAQGSLQRHDERHGRPGGRLSQLHVERACMLARRDALADAYAIVVGIELGLQLLQLPLDAKLQHARTQVAAFPAETLRDAL